MKLGVLTAAFPTLSLDAVSDWATKAGFETLEVAVWPSSATALRRYAGTAHIDVAKSGSVRCIADRRRIGRKRSVNLGACLLSKSARPRPCGRVSGFRAPQKGRSRSEASEGAWSSARSSVATRTDRWTRTSKCLPTSGRPSSTLLATMASALPSKIVLCCSLRTNGRAETTLHIIRRIGVACSRLSRT